LAIGKIPRLFLLAFLILTPEATIRAEEPSAFIWLILDATNGRTVREDAQDDAADSSLLQRIGPGSTLKPFLYATALLGGLDPRRLVECPARPIETPQRERCWLAQGHGSVNLIDGLAHSCSVYARHACRFIDADRHRRFLLSLGLRTGVPEKAAFRALGCEGWMGAEAGITVTPRELGEAYRRFFITHPEQSGPLPDAVRGAIREGMIESCRRGTSKDVRAKNPLLSIFGKTGTGFAADGSPAGIFVGLLPADRPRFVLVVVAWHTDGATTARLAGRIIAETWPAGPDEPMSE